MAYKSFADLIKPQEEEPVMSEMAPADYENMQSPVAPEMLYSTPKLADALPPKPEQPEVPMLAEADTQQTPPSETPMSKSEALIAEYQKMLGRDQQALEDARSRDRMLKVGGSIGDALATYLNAKSQMNVKAPGVQVQQGAGLGKVADMFATAPEIQSDVATRREALMKQYAELARGERAEARAQTQKEIASERNKIAEERNKLFGQQVAKMGSGREEARQFREEKFEYDKIKNLQDSFNKDKQVVKAEERMASARTMRDFLSENNPIGAEAAKRFAARASGEVGTLTDQDVSVFGGSRAVLDRLQQAAQELATGTLTENNKKFMNQLANTFEKAGQRDLQDRLDIYAKQGTKRTKMSEGEVKETIRPDLVLQQKEQSNTTQPQTIIRFDPKSKKNVEYDATTKKPIRFVD
jgi:hypothetical protein